MRMKQYTYREFSKLLCDNGYKFIRQNGDHRIFGNGSNTISVPYDKHVNCCMAKRLIKENSLIV